jgi:hypothetical protein
MEYPGHVIKVGETSGAIVKALKARLNEVLGLDNDPDLKLDANNPTFGNKMEQAVKLFQARNLDSAGRPLVQDGEIGSITWGALFGDETTPSNTTTADPFLAAVLGVADGEEQKKVREVPKNSNKGPAVSQYLASVGLDPGYSWCCAFVYWCFDKAAKNAGRDNPMYRTAGCMDHWYHAEGHGATCIPASDAVDDPSLVSPGMIFIIDHGSGFGHTGLVESVSGGLLTTIEGNTDGSGTREGGGVYRLTRKIADINTGYIDYTGV